MDARRRQRVGRRRDKWRRRSPSRRRRGSKRESETKRSERLAEGGEEMNLRPSALSGTAGGLSSRAQASLQPRAGASRAEADLSVMFLTFNFLLI